MAFDANDPADIKLLADKIEEATSGLKNKNNELIGEQKTLKSKVKEIEDRFAGLDPENIRNMLSRFENDEEAKLLAEGKASEVIAKRTERMRANFEKQLADAKQEVEKANSFAERFKVNVLASAIRDAAIKAGCAPEAADDFVLRGQRVFSVDNEGEVLALGPDGKAVAGKDGKTPLHPGEWVESLREVAPHLWPKAEGSGATGSGAKGTKKYSEMSEREKAELWKKNPEEAKKARENG